LLHFGKEIGYVFRIVLKVPVHGDNDIALGRVKSRLERCCLAEIPPQPDDAYTPILPIDVIQDFGCLIAAPVVYKDEFVRLPCAIQHAGEPCVERPNIFLLIVQRHDNGNHLKGRHN
jgi:hypothetical protein